MLIHEEEDRLPGISAEEDGLPGIGEEEDGLPGINTRVLWISMDDHDALPLVDIQENPFLRACPRGWQPGGGEDNCLLPGVWQEIRAFSLAIFRGVSCFQHIGKDCFFQGLVKRMLTSTL